MIFELRMRDNYKNGRAEGLAEGKAEGLVEGETQAKAQIVKNMQSLDIPLDKIVKSTGLSIDEVNNILSAKRTLSNLTFSNHKSSSPWL